jgi:hypothetical protein
MDHDSTPGLPDGWRMPDLVDRYWEWKRRRALRAVERRHNLAASLERLESLRDARNASAVPSSRPTGGESAAEDRNSYARLIVATDGSGPSLRAGEHAVCTWRKTSVRSCSY